MTFAKKELFDDDLQEMALYFKVLSHPARLAILKYLAEKKTCISGDISNELPLSRTTVSQHLQELKKAGLIHGEIDGVKVNYCLCNENIKKLKIMIDELTELIDVEIKCTL
ncbi:MAG: transcriptional regulator [Bacteroidetes bacterium GWE2_29_8]|nr:MAG: transcriptional regulator [Bacteroidetes bacterium GWE2_29_8]OFY24969.1 MAG: transcriptional regulator [Bacteroidetes bacterium GWF2_29_10]